MRWPFLCIVLLVALPAVAAQPADDVYTRGRLYTADQRQEATAMAVTAGRITYVGDDVGVRAFTGPGTRVHDLHGRRVLPGLVDAHIHPIDIVDLGDCDLKAQALTLAELVKRGRACVARRPPAPGEWISIRQWAATSGNTTDARYPTLRAALDAISADHPVELLGDDGHHNAYNSRALLGATDAAGGVVGLSRETLSNEFKSLRLFIGTDAGGNPDGRVDEDARGRISKRHQFYDNDIERVLDRPERMTEALNAAGITTVMEAAWAPASLPVYDALYLRGHLSLHVTLAQHYDPAHVVKADGTPDYDLMVARAVAWRDRFAHHPLIRADFVKMFADGEVEGNPFAATPVHGNAALLNIYRSPRFERGADGHPRVIGYDPPPCPVDGDAADSVCPGSRGTLQYPREVELEWARRMHLAGFNLHIHVIGDRATRTAIDAIEAARAADGNVATHDSLAHIQLAAPEDVVRMGRDHLYLAYTYSWAMHDPDYDPSAFPYLSETPNDPYFEEQMYPVRQSRDAGAVLTAGSDAPVASRDPRSFMNMAMAVTRRLPGGATLSKAETISIEDVIDAYTINGARMLGRDDEVGSLSVGKAADFIVLDHDPVALAARGKADDIANVRVLETWFGGQRVYARALKISHD
jgi:predicted amidohydrolase YtcJ